MIQKIYSPNQVKILLNAEITNRAIFAGKLAILTGLRMNEIPALYWDDIDCRRHQIYVHRSVKRRKKEGEQKRTEEYIANYIKSKKEYYVPISSDTESMITDWYYHCGSPDICEPIFMKNDVLLTSRDISKALNELLGSGEIRIIRRTTAHALVLSDNRYGIYKARRLCGHSETYVTKKHYAAIQDYDRTKLIEKLSLENRNFQEEKRKVETNRQC